MVASTGRPAATAPAPERQQRDLGGGVEAESEQQPDGEHLPGAGDEAHQAIESKAHEQATGDQHPLQLALLAVTGAHPPGNVQHIEQDREVQAADDPQEATGYDGAEKPADVGDRGDAVHDQYHEQREDEHDGGVTKGEENPTPTGRSVSLESLRVALSIAAMWSASKA